MILPLTIIDELEKMATIKQFEFLFDHHIKDFYKFSQLKKRTLSETEFERDYFPVHLLQ